VLEAVSRPSMRLVVPKSLAQQDLLALHRVRARLLKQRIALSNQARAVPRAGRNRAAGRAGLRAGVAAAVADEGNELSA
jgi:transposase